MKLVVAILAVGAFFLGSTVAQEPPDKIAKLLFTRQKDLFRDLEKIARASKDIKELRETRESGKFILNEEERKLERSARKDFHIFMERIRNNTLEVLAIYDRELGKEAYIDPLRKIFGKSLYSTVQVNWDEQGMDEIVDELIEGYGVKMFIKGDINVGRTMSLQGNMTLLAILLQIENTFDAKLIHKNDTLWFVKIERERSTKTPVEEKDPKKDD